MFGLLPVVEVLFTDLLAPRAIVSLGKALGVLSLGAEVYLHRANAKVGRNPVVRDEVNKNVEKQEGEQEKTQRVVFRESHGESYEFFQLNDLGDSRLKHVARSWLLTPAEKQHLGDITKRDFFQRSRNKEEHEIQKLMLFSDNRLVQRTFVEPVRRAIIAMGKMKDEDGKLLVDPQDTEDALRHLREAVDEAKARKNLAA